MFSMSKGITFDDVLLEPVYNGIKSRQLVTTAVKLRDFEFKIPVCSSNMDTITEVNKTQFHYLLVQLKKM